MGIPRPKDLSDLIRLEAHLKVTCTACGRSGAFPVRDVLAYFRNRGWNSAWQVAGRRFGCHGTEHAPGCGHQGATYRSRRGWSPVLPPPEPTARDLKAKARRERS